MLKKTLAILLCIILTAFSFSATASAATATQRTQYPFVFVHGLMGWGEGQMVDKIAPYWGTTGGSVIKYLEKKGFDVCSASVGGASSAWDRACELYAQLAGTRVDYGEAHSTEHGHSRYGRTYAEPLCASFGKKDGNGNIIKINLVGHSMGGVTIRLFASILEHGIEEEIKAGNDVSPFFKGGKGNFIHSITTLSAPHNGSSAADKENILAIRIMLNMFYYIWGVLDNTPLRPFWDIQLEQFGLTDYPADGFEGEFNTELIKSMIESEDSAYYDLTLKGAAETNERIKLLDDVYYFSYSSECVFEGPLTGNLYPEPTMNPLFLLTSPGICKAKKGEVTGVPIDESWRVNDGIVNTVSAKYPTGDRHTDYDADSIEKGIWNVMPTLQSTDHTDYMGVFASPIKTRMFYRDLCELVCSLPD